VAELDAERRAFLRDLALLLCIPGLAVVGLLALWRPWEPATYELPEGVDMYVLAAGTWDWSGAEEFCEKNPHTISFSPDKKVMSIRHKEPWTDSAGVVHRVAEYDLEEVTPRHLRGQIRGERRQTPAGEPVVWDLVPTSRDSYRWHRVDWPSWMMTGEVRRCLQTTDSTDKG
jgi:hypothetical protein